MNLKSNSASIFTYYSPDNPSDYKGLVSIPHSGLIIAEEFQSFITEDEKIHQKDVDFAVDKLVNIERLNSSGIGVLVAHISRACVDLNRAPHLSVLNWKKNTLDQPIVIQNPDEQTIQALRAKYYDPYYAMMKSIIEELEVKKKKFVSFIDLHSMPSKPTAYHMKQYPDQNPERPDFCISDLNETSCEGNYLFYIQNHLSIKGHEVRINDPYYGGYVTQFASKFRTNAVQIEINRGIYMDEDKQELILDKSNHIKKDLTEVLIGLFTHFDS